MSISYALFSGGSLLIARYVGIISHSELLSRSKQLLQDTSISPDAQGLADVRQAIFTETDPERVRELTELYADPHRKAEFSKYAILARTFDGQLEKINLFAAQLGAYGVNTKVFTHLAPASKWLGLDPFEAEDLIACLPAQLRFTETLNRHARSEHQGSAPSINGRTSQGPRATSDYFW